MTDNDPLYAQFLRAGAARVQVPVRPGFEANVMTYLSTGEIWAADGTVVSSGDDSLDLSIIDRVELVTNEESLEMARRLAREEGILSGISCGAAMTVARKLANCPRSATVGKSVADPTPTTWTAWGSAVRIQAATASDIGQQS